MTQKNTSKTMHISLWAAQLLLAAGMAWGGITKLFTPATQLVAMWPWTGEIPLWVVKGTGIIDLLGAIGLILPALLRIQPKLVPVTAVCIIVLMLCASIFHILRGEAGTIVPNVIFAAIAMFIVWGRLKKPIKPR